VDHMLYLQTPRHSLYLHTPPRRLTHTLVELGTCSYSGNALPIKIMCNVIFAASGIHAAIMVA